MICDLGDYFLQLELCENGHEDYSCVDESSRLELIAADLGKRGYALRINPDSAPCFKRTHRSSGESTFAPTPACDKLMPRVAAPWMSAMMSSVRPVNLSVLCFSTAAE